MAKRRIDIIPGQTFGRLAVLREVEPYQWSKYKHRMVQCLCACGKETVVRLEYLRSGHTTSCGCIIPEVSASINKTHMLAGTRIYSIWSGMIQRCTNKKNSCYINYGGRGISVCDEWAKNFMAFHEWAFANGYSHNLSIDRIDNDGNYEPTNCRWSSREAQANNKRSSRLIEFNGKTKSLAEWARDFNLSAGTLESRLKRGWDFERALTFPLDPRGQKRC